MQADLGTPELQQKRAYVSRNWKNPKDYRVDEFYRAGIIGMEEMEAGKRLYRLHMIATNQAMKSVDLENEVRSDVFYRDDHPTRMDAARQNFEIMSIVRSAQRKDGIPYAEILKLVCLEELPMESKDPKRPGIAKQLKKRRTTVEEWLPIAFEKLLEAQQIVFEMDNRKRKEGESR